MTVYHSHLLGAIELTEERKTHIITAHPEMKIHMGKIASILQAPDVIRRSKIDKNVLLFYRYFAKIKGGKYITISVKTNQRKFILTAYITDRIKAGKPYETEKKPS